MKAAVARAGLLLVGLTGCLQELDEGAASGGGADEPAISLETPPIELPGGETTSDPCVLTVLQAKTILETNCAACHGGGSPGARQGQPPFDYVLDFDRLLEARSESVPDPSDPSQGMRFVVPGDPEASRVYLRIAVGEMPPELPVDAEPLPRPSISDTSVLYAWIELCME